MPARSKPYTRPDSNSSLNITTAENMYLKEKNAELAKALTKSQHSCTTLLNERTQLHKEILVLNAQIRKLQNHVKTIEISARATMNTIVSSSNYVTSILKTINSMDSLKDESKDLPCSSVHNSPNKTQAVPPMIDGHCILRPTINLARINTSSLGDVSGLHRNQLENHANASNPDETDAASNGTFESFSGDSADNLYGINEENAEVDDDTDDNHPDISDGIQRENRVRNTLSPLLEQTENSTSNNSRTRSSNSLQGPLLSGVFRDVRVYLSPLKDSVDYINTLQQSSPRGLNRIQLTPKPDFKKNKLALSTSDSSKSVLKTSSLTSTIVEPSSSFNSTTERVNENSPKCSSNFVTVRTKHENFIVNQSPPEHSNSVGWSRIKENVSESDISKVENASRNSFPISCSAKLTTTNSSNSLEGRSYLLDSLDEISEDKLITLGRLGLQPRNFLLNNSSTPIVTSPASAVLQRRKRQLNLSEQPESPPTPKTTRVTKRKLVNSKKTTVVSTKLLKRMSRAELLELSSRRSIEQPLPSTSANVSMQSVTSAASSDASNDASNDAATDSASKVPRKRGRPRRGVQPTVLKEPSLKMKLRRSK